MEPSDKDPTKNSKKSKKHVASMETNTSKTLPKKGPDQSKTSAGKKSQEPVEVSNKKNPSEILFDEEPSLEFKETVLNVSTSNIIGEHSEGSSIKKKRSYRKLSFEVCSSLPLVS